MLVHCKKGISRSSSTVIAYAMKNNEWSMDKAVKYVKGRRDCITPNKGFMEQLRIYEGILMASKHRHNGIFDRIFSSRSSPNPTPPPMKRNTCRPIDRQQGSSRKISSSLLGKHILSFFSLMLLERI